MNIDEARDVIDRHATAINEREPATYKKTVNFPFTYQNYNGVALTIATADDYGVTEPFPWEIILTTHREWSHTEFDAVAEVARSPTSAVYKVAFRRIDRTGASDGPFAAIWIATSQVGHWGVQFRHNLGRA